MISIQYRLLAFILLTLIVLEGLSLATASDKEGNWWFYMYGSSTCPHCRSMDGFLNKSFTGHLKTCYIDLSTECRKRYDNLVETTIIGQKKDGKILKKEEKIV